MIFYLGIYREYWATKDEIKHLPILMSAGNSRIRNRKKPIHHYNWLLDSGGFTQLDRFGRYTISEDEYADMIRRLKPRLAFCQDWMCEGRILAKTGLSVTAHQLLTLRSYLGLRKKVGDIVCPVIQGQTLGDYLRHIRMYRRSGTQLDRMHAPLVGLGSVCRRSSSPEIAHLIAGIKKAHPWIRLHGFGVKLSALKHIEVVENLESSDSMAWQYLKTNKKDLAPFCSLSWWGPHEVLCLKRRCDKCIMGAANYWERAEWMIEERFREIYLREYWREQEAA